MPYWGLTQFNEQTLSEQSRFSISHPDALPFPRHVQLPPESSFGSCPRHLAHSFRFMANLSANSLKVSLFNLYRRFGASHRFIYSLDTVRQRGLEPPRRRRHQPLKLTCLPIPPLPRMGASEYDIQGFFVKYREGLSAHLFVFLEFEMALNTVTPLVFKMAKPRREFLVVPLYDNSICIFGIFIVGG